VHRADNLAAFVCRLSQHPRGNEVNLCLYRVSFSLTVSDERGMFCNFKVSFCFLMEVI
jgi:hypothetical protein